MKHLVASFLNDEAGATAIEYGLLCALIAVALIGTFKALTPEVAGLYGSVAGAIPQD